MMKDQEQRKQTIANDQLLDSLPIGLFTYDRDGNILYANARSLQVIGSDSLESTISKNVFTFSQSVKYGISSIYQDCITSGRAIIEEMPYVSASGKAVFLRIQAVPVFDAVGQVTSGIAIIEDFSERKRMEQELLLTKEQAERSDKAKSQFLANMSHEIRTPINGFMGMTELALMTDLTEEQREYLTLAQASAKALLRIIDDVLDLSKIEAGKTEHIPRWVNVERFFDDFKRVFSSFTNKEGLDFSVDIDPEIPKELFLDSALLQQVLSNLLANAVKFTRQGSIRLEIKMTKILDNQVMLEFSIEDTGIGIKEQDLPRLFINFSQLDDSWSKPFSGTGLGLAISKRLVELMGGQIWVESEFGKGSKFTFTINAGIAQDL